MSRKPSKSSDDFARWRTMTLSDLAAHLTKMETFHKQMCQQNGPQQWKALAIQYSQRIEILEEAVREAADFAFTDNTEFKRRIQARLRALVGEAA